MKKITYLFLLLSFAGFSQTTWQNKEYNISFEIPFEYKDKKSDYSLLEAEFTFKDEKISELIVFADKMRNRDKEVLLNLNDDEDLSKFKKEVEKETTSFSKWYSAKRTKINGLSSIVMSYSVNNKNETHYIKQAMIVMGDKFCLIMLLSKKEDNSEGIVLWDKILKTFKKQS